MRWTEITIETTTMGADAMAEVLFNAGVAGVSIEDPADISLYQRPSEEWDYIDETIFSDHGSKVYVKGYLPVDETEKVEIVRKEAKRVAQLSNEQIDFGQGIVTTRQAADEEWQDVWKQYYKPFTVEDKLAIVPEWESYDATGRTVVRLEPGAAFGTGQHETTRMCLSLIARRDVKEKIVLDIGCGTGILGISAVLLGATSATLIDRDPVAISAARHNAELNGCENKVATIEGNLADSVKDQYDVIFANIVANAIIALIPEMPALLAPDGVFIASGIIVSREEDVTAAARAGGFVIAERECCGEWVALCLQRG